MDSIVSAASNLQLINQLWLSLFILIPMVLIARTVVAGTRYSPILIIVVFGLAMGYMMVATGASQPGLPEFSLISMLSRTTIVALAVAFFVGGQELRRIFFKAHVDEDDMLQHSEEETILGTNRTQLMFVLRAFFLLLGIEALYREIVSAKSGGLIDYYPVIAYIGLVMSFILIDHKAAIRNKRDYLRRGLIEIGGITAVLVVSFLCASWIKPLIALPQIFFAMIIASGLGALLYRWHFGPTMRSLLFAGIPVVLAANFIIGGSRISDAFSISGMNSVLAYGFFGQLFWMFGGIALLMLLGRTGNARNLAPGMAGSLSHSGLTGACTAGDFGQIAAQRAPIMINVPFAGHIFVFSILAISAEQGKLMLWPALVVAAVGIVFTVLAMRTLSKAGGDNSQEVKGLMQFSLGWQLTAMFAGMTILALFGMPLDHSALAKSSALSHFGLFAATQEGMFGPEAAALIPFIFSMPFLVHPFVFFLFGKAMSNNGEMPRLPVFILAAVGLIGSLYALLII